MHVFQTPKISFAVDEYWIIENPRRIYSYASKHDKIYSHAFDRRPFIPHGRKITFSFAIAYMNKATALVNSPRHIPWGCCPPRGHPPGPPPLSPDRPSKAQTSGYTFFWLALARKRCTRNLLWKYDFAQLYMKTGTYCVSCNSRKLRETKVNILGRTK